MIAVPMTWLDPQVRTVMAAAYEVAAGRSRTVIGEEHLLAALLETPSGATWLTPLTAAQARAEILPAVGQARVRGGLSATDRAALDGLGVDLVSLEQRLDGLGADEATRGPARPVGGWGQRVTDALTVVLGRAEDLAVGSRSIALAHLVTALVEVPSLVTEHLAARGVTTESVRGRLDS